MNTFIIYAFVCALSFSNSPLFARYNGFEQSETVLRNPGLTYEEVLRRYLSTLPSRPSSLSEDDVASAYGGYLNIVEKMKDKSVRKAQDDYRNLIEDLNLSFYRTMLSGFNVPLSYLDNSRLIFPVRILELLQKTNFSYGNPYPIRTKTHTERDIILHIVRLKEDVEKAGHKLISGKAGLKNKLATPQEREKMLTFLVSMARNAVDRGDNGINHLLRYYDTQNVRNLSESREKFIKHIKMCRIIFSVFFYLIKNGKSSVSEDDLLNIQEMAKSTSLGVPDISLIKKVFKDDQIVSLLRKNIPLFCGFEERRELRGEVASSRDVRSAETDYSFGRSYLTTSMAPFRTVFDSDHWVSISNTINLISTVYENRQNVLKFCQTLYNNIKAKKAIKSPLYGTVYPGTYNENCLFQKALEDYMIKIQRDKGLSYAPVFQSLGVLGLSGASLPDSEGFKIVLGTIEVHLKDGMRMLYQASKWVEANPLYKRDFFKNAFYNRYSGCLPIKNVLLSDWIESRVNNKEGEYIYDHFILRYHSDFYESIGHFLRYFKEKCLIELIKRYPGKSYEYLTDDQIDVLTEFQAAYNKESFVNWAVDAARKAYEAKKCLSLFSSSPYSKREDVRSAVEVFGVF